MAKEAEIVSMTDAQVERALRGEVVTLEIEDPQATALSIIDRILASDNKDAILGGSKAIGGREILGRPFTLLAVRWHHSSFAGETDSEGEGGGFSVFAVLDAQLLDDGERVAVTSGAGNVMAQAFQLSKIGALPCDVKIVESERATAGGFRPQWLEAA